MWSKGRTSEKPSIPSFVVHFSRSFYREQFARRLGIGSFPGSPIHLRLPPLTPLRKPETLPVITYPVRHMCTRLEGPQVNRAGRYDATCLLASHNSPSFRLLDNRGEGIRWISTDPLLTWNCYVCNEVIMQRWTTERDLCTLRIFGNRFAGYKRYLGNISVNISEEREILRCFEYREKDNLDIIIFVNRWEEGRNVELLE